MKNSYNAIRAWGQILGSYQYYTEDQIETARADNAPNNAIFKNYTTGKWDTINDIECLPTLREIANILSNN